MHDRMLAFAAAACLLAAPLHAAVPPPPCSFSLPPAQLQECSETLADVAQQRLDSLMSTLRKSLPARSWSHLKESQILWEKSRNDACAVEGWFEDVPFQTSARYQCEAWYNRERMHQLRYILCPRYWRTGQCEAAKDWE